MEVDIFSIFPNRLLHLHDAGNVAATFADITQHIVDHGLVTITRS